MEFRFGFNGLWGPLTATLPGIGVRCSGGIERCPASAPIRTVPAFKPAVTRRRFGIRRGVNLVVRGVVGEMLASCFSSSDRVRNSLTLL